MDPLLTARRRGLRRGPPCRHRIPEAVTRNGNDDIGTWPAQVFWQMSALRPVIWAFSKAIIEGAKETTTLAVLKTRRS